MYEAEEKEQEASLSTGRACPVNAEWERTQKQQHLTYGASLLLLSRMVSMEHLVDQKRGRIANSSVPAGALKKGQNRNHILRWSF